MLRLVALASISFFAQISEVMTNCSSIHKTCGNCFVDPSCFWCLDPPGCMNTGQKCHNKYKTQNSIQIDDSPTNDDQLIYPEHASMNLIPGQPEEIDFKVTQFKEYPVDLYFLVDLSWSMRGARDNIAIEGENILRGINEFTKDLKIGFGSFIEKNVPPFTSAIPRFNCPMDPSICSPPYSFYHQMPLQELSPDTFSDRILSAPLGGNVDEPEASFDALVQTMACHKQIGWRNNSRKIILLATDGDFHFALDGKLLGLLEPNDGHCHLNNNGYFTKEKIMDYPSISQIEAIARTGSFTLIFAVASRYHEMYQHLTKQIRGSRVASLEKDATNIVDIIKELYEKITTTVEVSLKIEESEKSNFTVRIFANCDGEYEETKVCNNIEIGTPIQFKAVVNLNECFNGKKNFQISVVGIPKSMVVEMESKCSCSCENNNNAPSEKCGFNGIFQCGTCYCFDGFMGEKCDCENEFTVEEQNEACINPNEDGSNLCSNKGKCICGECECSNPFYGSYCECDDYSCPVNSEGELCSRQGKCICNQCKCDSNWEGPNCGCSTNKEFCKSPFNGKECSGNGVCECNKRCNCKTDFSGKFCQILPQTSDSCSLLRDCVEQRLFDEDFKNEDLKKECSVFKIKYVSPERFKSSVDGELCVFSREKDGCSYEFGTKLSTDNELIIYAIEDKEKRCVYYHVDYMLISLSTIGATIFLGLLCILLYKLYLIRQDKREYEKFLISKQNSSYALNHNALYKNPISNFQNPTYRPSRPYET